MSDDVPLTLDMERTPEGLKMFVEPLLKEPEDIQLKWAHVLKVAESARGTKPTKKLTTSMRAAIQDLGEAPFKRGLIDFANNLTGHDDFKIDRVLHRKDGTISAYYNSLNEHEQNIYKAILWSAYPYEDPKLMDAITKIAEIAHTTISDLSLAVPSVGNAALWALAHSPAKAEALAHLKAIEPKITTKAGKKSIQRYLAETTD